MSLLRILPLVLLLSPAAALAHVEDVRTDLDALFAEAPIVLRGNVVLVEALEAGSEPPHAVTVAIDRVYRGATGTGAATFEAPGEHQPWRIGERAVVFLSPAEGALRYRATALRAESPGAEGLAARSLDTYFTALAGGPEPAAHEALLVEALRSPAGALARHASDELHRRAAEGSLAEETQASLRGLLGDRKDEVRAAAGMILAVARDVDGQARRRWIAAGAGLFCFTGMLLVGLRRR